MISIQAPTMISRVLMAASTANEGQRNSAISSTCRGLSRMRWLRLSTKMISAPT
ncbi:hypothetical protein D3C72_2593410 [compost metagenome]